MGTAIVGAVGALLGTVIGSLLALLSQRVAYRRERRERDAALRREVCARFLSATHQLYAAVDAAHVSADTVEERRGALSAIGKVEAVGAQEALDVLRLAITSAQTLRTAEGLFSHLRGTRVPEGSGGSTALLGEWKSDYRKIRARFTDAARTEVGLPPLSAEPAR